MLRRATLLATALATALGVSQSANAALSMDYAGGGGGGLVQQIGTLTMFRGDILVKSLFEGGNAPLVVDSVNDNNPNVLAGHAAGQVFGQLEDGYFSYQFIFDDNNGSEVIVSPGFGGNEFATSISATGGTFRLFWNPKVDDMLDTSQTPDSPVSDNDKAGLCYGDLGGDPLCGDGTFGPQVMLMEGVASLTNPLVLGINSDTETHLDTTDDTVGAGSTDLDEITANHAGADTVMSWNISGGFLMAIDIMTQNRDYVLNEFVDNTILIDVDVDSSSNAPYTVESAPSASVVGETAYFGTNETHAVDEVLKSDGVTVSIPAGSYTGPVNNFGCNGSPSLAIDPNATLCDFQGQTSPTVTFTPPPVSEPAPLLLAGLGLGLMGYMSRRRRKA